MLEADSLNDTSIPKNPETVVLEGGEYHSFHFVIPQDLDKIEPISRIDRPKFGHLRYERTNETTEDGLTIFRYTPPVGILEHTRD